MKSREQVNQHRDASSLKRDSHITRWAITWLVVETFAHVTRWITINKLAFDCHLNERSLLTSAIQSADTRKYFSPRVIKNLLWIVWITFCSPPRERRESHQWVGVEERRDWSVDELYSWEKQLINMIIRMHEIISRFSGATKTSLNGDTSLGPSKESE